MPEQPKKKPTLLLMFDLNWSVHDAPHPFTGPSTPQDWAFIDPREYLDWHLEMGNNAIFLQAYTYGGYAFYPTRLGPVPPGPGRELLPRLYDLAREAGLPFWSYFCVGADVAMSAYRHDWVIPESRRNWWHGFLAPESPWADLFCARVEEFLEQFPVDWILFDWFCYGDLDSGFHVQPAWFVKQPFREIIGREMPEDSSQITPEESLTYKREVLARFFVRIRKTVKETSPATRIAFNPPYWKPADPLWVDHPMVNESDGLLAEYSKPEILQWLESVRRPEQQIIATPINVEGVVEEEVMLEWAEKGYVLNGYIWGTPPGLEPHPSLQPRGEAIRRAFHLIARQYG
jgi:hypothetical protein